MARSIYDFFHDDYNRELIDRLRRAGVRTERLEEGAAAAAESPIAGKTVVVTGALRNYTRGDIQELLRRLGARAASSVSRKTDFVIVGESPVSKAAKAKQLGVKMVTEEEFETLIRSK